MKHVGAKVKELRLARGMTLKQLSEQTNISIGYLSQFERDQTTIAIDSLQNIAKVFNVSMTYFITDENNDTSPIVRSYAQRDLNIINSRFISKILVNDVEVAEFLPRLVEILPIRDQGGNIESQTHEGVEFIYVLEGVLDLFIDGTQHSLYPGDAAYFSSEMAHNWVNNTSKTVKLLSINSPNSLKKEV